LFFNKFAHSLFLNVIQVILHAHLVIFPVSIVKVIDSFAGILVAFKTKSGIALRSMVYSRAFFEKIRALFVSRPAAHALASLQDIDIRKIPAANGAIHTARRDKLFGNRIVFFHVTTHLFSWVGFDRLSQRDVH
jgi:hypothetical protein